MSRFDFMLYHTLRNYNADQLPLAFPRAPDWWPTSWGHLPVTLPWEFTLKRALLVGAKPDSAVWREAYQLFLEQLAGGWDLQYLQIDDRSRMEPLPIDVANAIIYCGGFAFCSGDLPSGSFRKFVDLHPIGGYVPDQRRARSEAWRRIEKLREKEAQKNAQSREAACACGDQLERAVHRLGIDAQALEAAPGDAIGDIGGDIDRLASLASAKLSYSINADGIFQRVNELLGTIQDQQYYTGNMLNAQRVVRDAGRLAQSLPFRFSASLSRLS